MEQWWYLWESISDSRVFFKNNSFSTRRKFSIESKVSVSNNFSKDARENWFNLRSNSSPIIVDRWSLKCFHVQYTSTSQLFFSRHQFRNSTNLLVKIRFLDQEKIDEIANFKLPLVITIIIADQALTRLLVNDISSCGVLYVDALEQLGLWHTYLSPFGREVLLTFNNLVTRPCGAINLTLSIGEGTHMRGVTLIFLMTQCISTFKGIIGNLVDKARCSCFYNSLEDNLP